MAHSIKRSCSLHVRWLNDTKFLQQLSDDNIDIDIINKELYSEDSNKKQTRIQKIILNILQCHPMQILIAILVLIDAGIVIAEIVLEIHSMKNKIEAYSEQMRDTIHFLNNTYGESLFLDNIDIQSLEETSTNHKELDLLAHILQLLPHSAVGFQLSNKSSCTKTSKRNLTDIENENKVDKHGHQEATIIKQHRSTNLHNASEMLHFASIALLGLFVIELTLKILCVGPSFFKARFEIIDAIVILTSFVADIVIVVVGSQEISVMIIFLLWRIVRVINGLIMHEKQRDEFRIFLQKKARRISEMKLEELVIQKEMKEKHCLVLEEVCVRAGVSPDIIKKCKPKFNSINSKCHTNNPLKSIAALTSGFMGTIVGAHSTNKFIHKFVFHSNSSSPVCMNKSQPNSIVISGENNSVNSSNSDSNHKSHFFDTLAVPKEDVSSRRHNSPINNQNSLIKNLRINDKNVSHPCNGKRLSNYYPDNHNNYLIEAFISSPVIQEDVEQKD